MSQFLVGGLCEGIQCGQYRLLSHCLGSLCHSGMKVLGLNRPLFDFKLLKAFLSHVQSVYMGGQMECWTWSVAQHIMWWVDHGSVQGCSA